MITGGVIIAVALALSGWAGAQYSLVQPQDVPSVDPNYALDVQTWWAQHPLNPENPSGIPIGGIGSRPPVINVRTQFDGNTQAAINALPESGGTLLFPPGVYQPFQIIGRSHIHFISDGGATIVGHSGIFACPQSTNYTNFNRLVFTRDPASLDCFSHPVQDFYFKNLTFDGNHSATTAVDMAVARDVVFDRVTFQNYRRVDVTYEIGLINADRGSDNIWCRGCHFVGSQRMAVFMDGVHGGGIVDSRFEKDFYAMWLMFGTNDDFTIDVNHDGKYDLQEQRTSQYIVVANNTFYGPIYEGLDMNGMRSLVANNVEKGTLYFDFARYTARCSQRGGDAGLVYVDEGNVIVDNQVDQTPIFVKMDQSAGRLNCPHENYGRLGRYIIRNNAILKTPPDFRLVAELGSIIGPNSVEGNCVNTSRCRPAPTPVPTAPSTPFTERLQNALILRRPE